MDRPPDILFFEIMQKKIIVKGMTTKIGKGPGEEDGKNLGLKFGNNELFPSSNAEIVTYHCLARRSDFIEKLLNLILFIYIFI